jgi:hypothetical protein
MIGNRGESIVTRSPRRHRGPSHAARGAEKHRSGAGDRTELHRVTGGVDLTQIEALKLLAEIGTDVRRWPTAQTSRPG